jgi:hypothetical protein
MGRPFVAQKGNPWALGCDDVAATRTELEAKGVTFAERLVARAAPSSTRSGSRAEDRSPAHFVG